MTKLLEGIVDTVQADQLDELRELRAEVAHFKEQFRIGSGLLEERQQEIDRLKRVINNLRGQLSPLHKALRALFGEIDGAGLEELPQSAATSAPNPAKSAVWETWKSRLPGTYPGKFIDALLEHGMLNATQLSIITGCHRSNISKEMYKLNKANLVNKTGDKWSLKQL